MHLIDYLHQLYPLTESSHQQLLATIESHAFGPKESITSHSKSNSRIWFVQQGIVGQFMREHNQSVCRAFAQPEAIIYTLPEGQWLQAITRCELESVPYGSIRNMEQHQRLLIEAQLRRTEQLLRLQRLRPLDRYRHLIHHDAEVIQQVSNTLIASFIGISLESLSRLKSRM